MLGLTPQSFAGITFESASVFCHPNRGLKYIVGRRCSKLSAGGKPKMWVGFQGRRTRVASRGKT